MKHLATKSITSSPRPHPGGMLVNCRASQNLLGAWYSFSYTATLVEKEIVIKVLLGNVLYFFILELIINLSIQREWDNDLEDENSETYKKLSLLLEKEVRRS